MSNSSEKERCAAQILDEKYRLRELIGTGGMGEVWRAEHLLLGTAVAIKFMAREHADTEVERQRFLREAQVVASLRGDGIVQILDFGIHQGTSYLVMELLTGISLEKHLEAENLLSPSQTALVMNQVGRAVARAHSAGIIHQDLKPANIFLLAENQTEGEDAPQMRLKLLDFGIAKRASDNHQLSHATQKAQFLGSPQYASPEHAQGLQSIDLRTDIWSMGVIAFECLLGHVPFEGATPTQILAAVCTGPLPVPSESGKVPEGFDTWFAQACCRKLAGRFETALDAAENLKELLEAATQESAGAELDIQQFTIQELSSPQSKPQALEAKRPKSHTKAPGKKKRFDPQPRHSESAGLHRNSFTRWWPLAALAGLLLLVGNGALRDTSSMDSSSTRVLHVAGDSTQALFVDNRKIASLPTAYRMTAGRHQIEIRRGPRYVPFERELSSTGSGDVLRIEAVQLKVLKGQLSLDGDSTTEGAQVTLLSGLKSRSLGSPPIVVEFDARQKNAILIARPGYNAFFQPLVFSDGRAKQRIHIRLEKLPEPEPEPELEEVIEPLPNRTPTPAQTQTQTQTVSKPAPAIVPPKLAKAPDQAIITEKGALTPAAPVPERPLTASEPVNKRPLFALLPLPPRKSSPSIRPLTQIVRKPSSPSEVTPSSQGKTSAELRKEKREQRTSERQQIRSNRGPTRFVDVRGRKTTNGLNPGEPGGLTGRAIDERATKRAYSLRPCWETWQRQNFQRQNIALKLEFRISFLGRVDSITHQQPTDRGQALAACVIAEAKTWVFPRAGLGTLAQLKLVFQGG